MAQGATWAERYATGGTQHRRLRRNAIPMPGRGLDDPGAERYATRAERSIDSSGGTLYRCQGVASMTPGRNAMPPGQNAASTAQAERYTDARAWPR